MKVIKSDKVLESNLLETVSVFVSVLRCCVNTPLQANGEGGGGNHIKLGAKLLESWPRKRFGACL